MRNACEQGAQRVVVLVDTAAVVYIGVAEKSNNTSLLV